MGCLFAQVLGKGMGAWVLEFLAKPAPASRRRQGCLPLEEVAARGEEPAPEALALEEARGQAQRARAPVQGEGVFGAPEVERSVGVAGALVPSMLALARTVFPRLAQKPQSPIPQGQLPRSLPTPESGLLDAVGISTQKAFPHATLARVRRR